MAQAIVTGTIRAPVFEQVGRPPRAVAPGGAVVCAGVHMSDIPSFPYADPWLERSTRVGSRARR